MGLCFYKILKAFHHVILEIRTIIQIMIEDTTHASANELMTANGLVDLLIPRGGAGLIRACVENATVPCIQTLSLIHISLRQYRIILSADTASAVRQMLSQKRR